MSEKNNHLEYESANGKRFAGLVIIAIGVVLLMKKMGVYVPKWVISWPMILIAVGLYNGFKHNFKNHVWWILSVIGAMFLADKLIDNLSFGQFIWPVTFVAVGLYLVFGKHNSKKKRWKANDKNVNPEYKTHSSSDFLDTVAVFGGIQKKIVSNDFKGADLVCIFSGAEINLTQSDINGTVVFELVNIFGGTTLIIPSNWELRSEVVSIFGGVDDKRDMIKNDANNDKILVLKGTSIFGGIDIKSY